MRLRLRHFIKRHFVIATVLFVGFAYPVHSHGWLFQIRFLFFAPVLLLHPLMPAGFFVEHDNGFHYVGIVVMTLIAFLYTWLIVCIVAKAYAYLKKRRDTKAL